MAESTAQQVMDIRAGLSHALGAATNALDRAREAHAAALERRRHVGEAAGARRRKVAEARDARLRDIDQRHHDDLAAFAEAAAGAADRAAPGARQLRSEKPGPRLPRTGAYTDERAQTQCGEVDGRAPRYGPVVTQLVTHALRSTSEMISRALTASIHSVQVAAASYPLRKGSNGLPCTPA